MTTYRILYTDVESNELVYANEHAIRFWCDADQRAIYPHWREDIYIERIEDEDT